MLKIVEYTVNIGRYDVLREDLICFDDISIFKNNARNSRIPKILSHLYIDADVSVYWDANMYKQKDFNLIKFIEEDFEGFDIMAMRCSVGRDCVYQEIEAAKSRVPNEHERILLTEQSEYYKSFGFPEHCKTLAGYQPLIRRHNDKVKRFNEIWWSHLSRFSYRDQCSFPVALSQCPDLKVYWHDDLTEITRRNYRHDYKPKVYQE